MFTNGLSSYLPQGLAPQLFGLGAPGLDFGQQGIAQQHPQLWQQFQNPLAGLAGAPPIIQQLAATLGQLAQQTVIQGALSQHIGATLQQLVQLVAVQSQYARLGQSAPGIAGSVGAFGQYGQYPFAQSGWGQNSFGQSPFASTPFASTPQGSFGALQPQGPAWAGARPGIQ
jgi:hypothetical protein